MYLLGYNAVYSVGSKTTFRRNVSPVPSGYKDKQEINMELTDISMGVRVTKITGSKSDDWIYWYLG
jgi:hypothetical protein